MLVEQGDDMTTTFPAAILFDCDGTLFDTETLKARSWARAMVELARSAGGFLGGSITEEEFAQKIFRMYRAGGKTETVAEHILRESQLAFKNSGLHSSINALAPKVLIDARNRAKDQIFDEVFPPSGEAQNQTARALLIEPVWNLAKEAKQRGYKIALVTTTKTSWVRRYFAAVHPDDNEGKEVLNPADFFDLLVCDKEKGLGVKEAVCRILGKLSLDEPADEDRISSLFAGIPPEEVANFLLIEDSPDGTQAGKAVGVRVITVPNKFTEGSFSDADCLLRHDEITCLADVLKRVTSRD